jgi:SAM-dependent methyltransferase
MDYARLYSYRFQDVDQSAREAVWSEIAPFITTVALKGPKRLLDPAAGRREFIDQAPAAERWAVDAVDHGDAHADPEVRLVVADIMDAELPAAHFDGVFVSNFLEHLPSPEAVYEFLRKMFEVTKPGGRIAIMGPNFRYCADRYFDFADHIVVLTHLAVVEHLHTAGFEVERVTPRFLPYSFTGRLPASAALTRLYLRMPFAWRLFGHQFLIVGRRPG